jgi:hypothetical protein
MSLERKILITAAVILLLPSALAANDNKELKSEISRSCDLKYEPVISMADPDSRISNPGPPDTYEYNLCVKGISESVISTSCDTTTGFYLSSKNRSAHFSEQNSYYWRVCTDRMRTRISSGPAEDNETALFSVSDRHNGHVAKPGFYNYNVYGRYRAPENVTLELEFNLSSSDDVYFDDKEVNGEQEFTPPAVFPYLISESDSESVVSGIVTPSFTKASRTFSNSKNRLSITRSGSGGFIVPFTAGDVDDINGKEEAIMNREFVNSISPNFGFRRIEKPNVKVRLDRADIVSDLSLSAGAYRINVTKTGESQVSIKDIG